jgi:hypothetical protein
VVRRPAIFIGVEVTSPDTQQSLFRPQSRKLLSGTAGVFYFVLWRFISRSRCTYEVIHWQHPQTWITEIYIIHFLSLDFFQIGPAFMRVFRCTNIIPGVVVFALLDRLLWCHALMKKIWKFNKADPVSWNFYYRKVRQEDESIIKMLPGPQLLFFNFRDDKNSYFFLESCWYVGKPWDKGINITRSGNDVARKQCQKIRTSCTKIRIRSLQE